MPRPCDCVRQGRGHVHQGRDNVRQGRDHERRCRDHVLRRRVLERQRDDPPKSNRQKTADTTPSHSRAPLDRLRAYALREFLEYTQLFCNYLLFPEILRKFYEIFDEK